MNLLTRALLMTHVARILVETEAPVSFDQLFEGFKGVETNKPVSTSWKRSIMGYLVSEGLVSRRGPAGREVYQAESSSSAMKRLQQIVDEGEHEEEKVKRHRYVMKREETIGRGNVLLRAIRRLLAAQDPVARSALFSAKKGDKFQERAAMIPVWQNEVLQRFADKGLIRKDGEGAAARYVAVNREELNELLDGSHHPCIYTYIYPDAPCDVDHEATRRVQERMRGTLRALENVATGSQSSDQEPPSTTIVLMDSDEPGSDPPSAPTALLPSDPAPAVASTSSEESKTNQLLQKLITTIEVQQDIHKSIARETGLLSEGYNSLTRAVEILSKRVDKLDSTFQESHDTLKSTASYVRAEVHSMKQLVSGIGPAMADMAIYLQSARKEDQERFEETVNSLQQVASEIQRTMKARSELRARVDAFVSRLENVTSTLEEIPTMAEGALQSPKAS